MKPIIEDYTVEVTVVGFNRTGIMTREEALKSMADNVLKTLSSKFGEDTIIVDYKRG